VVRPPPPGRRGRLAAFGVELATAGLGGAALFSWVAYVYPPPLLWIGFGWGLYAALGGGLARRLSPRVGPVLGAALAWLAFETARELVPPPFGLGWLRLGHYAQAHAWLAGAARVLGPEGLGFGIAAAGAGLAALVAARRAGGPGVPAAAGRALVVGGAPLGLLALAATLTGPPPTRPGPRVLLVQPGFEQARKQYGDPERNLLDSCELTTRALAELAERGEEPPDLVVWGESMLYVPLYRPEVREGMTADPPLMHPALLGATDLDLFDDALHDVVERALFGRSRGRRRADAVLPEGTSLLAGTELFVVRDGQIRRENAAALFGPDGTLVGVGSKRHLVPGAETMQGWERIPAVRRFIDDVAGYLPDFVPAEEVGVLPLSPRVPASGDGAADGTAAPWELAVTVCFDNAFLDAYVEPLQRGPLDFHVVLSNEAWYRESQEFDQMIAFTRIAAIATARAFVRGTNSGISAAFGPDGRSLGRIVVGGRDRAVRGAVLVGVPVPVPGRRDERTLYVRLFGPLRWVALLAGPLALLVPRRSAPRKVRNPHAGAG